MNFKTAFVHAVKVGLHIVWSIFVVGLVVFFSNHEMIPAEWLKYLTGFGIPVAIINVLWSGLVKYFTTHLSDVTIDSLPQ